MKRIVLTLTLVAAALVALPSAAAHASYETDDGEYRITVGYKGEPVYTYQTTGLELIIRDAEGNGVEGVNATLEATLISPSGEELSMDLEPQHGETSRYQFTDGFVLTETGLYELYLVGDINGSPVDGPYAMAHPTESRTSIMFPASGLDDIEALNDRIAALEAQVAALEQNGAGTNGDEDGNDANEAPAAPMLLAGLLAVGLLAFRRRD